MPRPIDKVCSDCLVYENIDGTKGHCKKHEAHRTMQQSSTGVESKTEPINGWPVINAAEGACADFE